MRFGLRMLVACSSLSVLLSSVSWAGVLEGFDSPERIPGQFIVVLKEEPSMGWIEHRGRPRKADRDAAHARNRERAAAIGRRLLGTRGAVGETFTISMKAFSAYMSDTVASEVSRDATVERVVAVKRTWTTAIQQNAPWHLDRIDQESWPLNDIYNYSSTGAFTIPNPQHLIKVVIFVVDSGIRLSHQQFGGRVFGNSDFVGSANGDELSGVPCNAHGTMVGGLIAGATYGVAKGATLESFRVVDCNGVGNSVDLVEAIENITDWAENFGIKGEFRPFVDGVLYYRPIVANTSVVTVEDSTVRKAINSALNAGVIWVSGAGNDKRDACERLPGAIPGVINVGATEIGYSFLNGKHDAIWVSDTTADGSNFGSCVDLFAPGGDVRSASNGSDTATDVDSGTSYAAPLVTGTVALYLASNPTKSPAEVQDVIKRVATENKIQSDLNGSPNLMLYTAVPGNSDIPGGDGEGAPPSNDEAFNAFFQAIIVPLLLD